MTSGSDLLQSPSAYLLVSHGSRDPRPQIAIEHLITLMQARLTMSRSPNAPQLAHRQSPLSSMMPSPLIGAAVLELAPLPLHQQIQQFAAQASSLGYQQIKLLPLFLLPGVHVMEDIPAEVAMAQTAIGPDFAIGVGPYLGCHPGLRKLLINPVDRMAADPTIRRIIVSHGSRRPDGNRPVETIATDLNALPAYWSVPPSLETQVTTWVKQGSQHIAILPYFLFEGGITDAIQAEVERLRPQFPYVQLHLGRVIGATPALAGLVWDVLNGIIADR